eukprot:1273219-Prymnesium_polylepis.1
MSRVPEPSGSHESKSSSTTATGASNFSSPIARWNSSRDTFPSLFTSHSRKRSITRAEAAVSALRSCSAT